jgi:hypothetical protein
MKLFKAILLSYAAGIIDGEGCITLHHNNARLGNTLNESWTSRIIVKMNDGKPLDLLVSLFGGRIDIAHDLRDGIFPSFTWELSSQAAADAAKKMLPFLRTKKKQAELLIRFQLRVNVGKKKMLGGKRGSPTSIHEVEVRRSYSIEMKRLNQDNIHIPTTALTTKQVERACVLKDQALVRKEQALMR